MATFDFSQFDQIANEIRQEREAQKGKGGRRTANSAEKIDAAFAALEPDTQNAFNFTGWIYKECNSKVTHPDKKCKEPLDFFAKSKPQSADDNFSAEKIKANFYFRCCVVALCAQNKGKIAVIDVVSLYAAFNLAYYYDTHNRSIKAVASKIQFDLRREAIVKGEWLEIPGIEMTSEASKYTALGNAFVAEWRAKFKGSSLNKSAAAKPKVARKV